MAIQTEQLQKVCDDLVAMLKPRLPEQDSDLVELIGQQYFMGTLSRLVSLSNSMDKQQAVDLKSQDLHFTLSFPEEIDPKAVQAIRDEATSIMATCLESLLPQTSGNAS